jgi:nickel transport protein
MRLLPLLFLLLPAMAAAHGVRTSVTGSPAAVVTVTHDDGTPLAFENVMILGPGDDAPYQTGRTDRHGRFSFVPDRAGAWRIRVTSADGHGDETTVTVTDDLVALPHTGTRPDRSWKILTGIGVLLGVFGLVAFVQARRS